MVVSENMAKEWENILTTMITNNSNLDVEEVRTYEEAGVLTNDKGIVIYTEDGEVEITIQAFKRR